MSALAGWVGGPEEPEVLARQRLTRMLEAVRYRGDATDLYFATGVALGSRFWLDRPKTSSLIHRDAHGAVACAGTLSPAKDAPAEYLSTLFRDEPRDLSSLDGGFAAAVWRSRAGSRAASLTLVRDPCGIHPLYFFACPGGRTFFSSELKQLLSLEEAPHELDLEVIHKYLTFSFVPGEELPIRGLRRLSAGSLLEVTLSEANVPSDPQVIRYVSLVESIDPELSEPRAAAERVRKLGKAAVRERITGEHEVALNLSGGLDSSAVGFWLRHAGQNVRAFTADFGERSVEREEAEAVAKALDMPLVRVPATGKELDPRTLERLVHRLDLPFGDPVTGPQWLLAKAASEHGIKVSFNGEGGDQLFGGWTNKPMLAHALFSGLYEGSASSDEEAYLRSYHRFYGLEDELYTPELSGRLGPKGRRRALLSPHLGDPSTPSFLNRIRKADILLKGEQNIAPRAERITSAFGIDVRMPLFDRELMETSFRIPPELKLHGASEKHVLKLALKGRLPDDIVWRRKYGMSVPVTDWTVGPLKGAVDDLLGDEALSRRGLFRPELVKRLREGRTEPNETRRRRAGEKLWCLLMLELWMRVFVDKRAELGVSR
ncbi:MAG: 7-cyano-7-deazaguanine synthase [Deltaproteobacteria bacterium]|nr:7-cyano-7-deazaguanine synthase [Deltaproteobacteria bacterium]